MAGVPIKFRCYRCNQLLGVARTKAGATVACPKCDAELLVPALAEPAPGTSSADATNSAAGQASAPNRSDPPAFGDGTRIPESGLAVDLLDIRPEDIRVEPGLIVDLPPEPATATATATAVPAPTANAATAPTPSPTAPESPPPFDGSAGEFSLDIDLSPKKKPAPKPSAAPFPIEAIARMPDPSAGAAIGSAPGSNSAPAVGLAEPVPAEILPPIQFDTRSRPPSARRAVGVRARDLILPRSVVAAWSLFVLLALALAFLAGLLAGHFVWRVH
jgi:hypothetical protein